MSNKYTTLPIEVTAIKATYQEYATKYNTPSINYRISQNAYLGEREGYMVYYSAGRPEWLSSKDFLQRFHKSEE
jgi:hypothetical protein